MTNTDRTFMLTPPPPPPTSSTARTTCSRSASPTPTRAAAPPTTWLENMPDAKIAIIYRNDDAYSRGIHDTFVTEAAAKGLNVVYEGTFTKDTATDFSVQLTGAQSAGADLVFPAHLLPARLRHPQPGQCHGLCSHLLRRGRHGRHSDHGGLRHLPRPRASCC